VHSLLCLSTLRPSLSHTRPGIAADLVEATCLEQISTGTHPSVATLVWVSWHAFPIVFIATPWNKAIHLVCAVGCAPSSPARWCTNAAEFVAGIIVIEIVVGPACALTLSRAP
jgi:hypothetical protein